MAPIIEQGVRIPCPHCGTNQVVRVTIQTGITRAVPTQLFSVQIAPEISVPRRPCLMK